MPGNAIRVIASGAILCLGPLLRLHAQTGTDRVEQISPFTHTGYIPAQSDTSTIRLEKIRYANVPTEILYTYHTAYCESTAARGSALSAYCPVIKGNRLVSAYELTYSFEGPRSASARQWQAHATFHVYFRPDELTSELRDAVDSDQIDRGHAAAHFTVTVSRPTMTKNVVDPAESTFCETALIDGLWLQTDPLCAPTIVHKTISNASSHLRVIIVFSGAHPQPGSATPSGKPKSN